MNNKNTIFDILLILMLILSNFSIIIASNSSSPIDNILLASYIICSLIYFVLKTFKKDNFNESFGCIIKILEFFPFIAIIGTFFISIPVIYIFKKFNKKDTCFFDNNNYKRKEHIVSSNKDNANFYYKLALERFEKKDYSSAKNNIELAMAYVNKKEYTDLLEKIKIIQTNIQNNDNTKQNDNDITENKPTVNQDKVKSEDSYNKYYKFSQIYYRTKKYDKALWYINSALEGFPNNKEFWDFKNIVIQKINESNNNISTDNDIVDNNEKQTLQGNKKIKIISCTKEELLTIDGFDEDKANKFLSERDKGKIYYDIDSFVNEFGLQPHQMIEAQDRLVFPPKPKNKLGRKIDW